MWRISALGVLVTVLVAVADVAAHDVVQSVWNEVDAGRGTAAEDALRVLRAVPLTQLSAAQRRSVKRRILAVFGLDHAPPTPSRGSVAVAEYMLALYRGGSDPHHDEDDGPSTSSSDDSGLLASNWLQLSSADTVISFANQGQWPINFNFRISAKEQDENTVNHSS